jgi:hypothetical protein
MSTEGRTIVLLIFAIAGAAALTVVAYSRLRARSPEAASAATRAVRELAAVVLVCTRAVEGVVDALQSDQRPRRPSQVAAGTTPVVVGTRTTTTRS